MRHQLATGNWGVLVARMAPVARKRWIGGREAAALTLRLLVLNSGCGPGPVLVSVPHGSLGECWAWLGLPGAACKKKSREVFRCELSRAAIGHAALSCRGASQFSGGAPARSHGWSSLFRFLFSTVGAAPLGAIVRWDCVPRTIAHKVPTRGWSLGA